MENIKRPGFVASVVNAVYSFAVSLLWSLFATGALALVFAALIAGIYDLCVAPTLGAARIGVWLPWGVLMIVYLTIQLVRAWLRKES